MGRFHAESFEPKSGTICAGCGHECDHLTVVDDGIGAYEYWGARGVHHAYHGVSPCCEEEMIEGGCALVSTTDRTARRDHKSGKVKAGQRYRAWRYHHWRRGGGSWFSTQCRVLA